MKNRLAPLAALLSLLALALLVVYSLWPRSAPAPAVYDGQPSSKGIALVESARIVRGDLEPLFSSLGTIEPARRAPVFAPSGSVVQQVLVKTGDAVAVDAPLAQVDNGALLRAPSAGVVTYLCCQAGERVVADSSVAVIEDYGKVYARAELPERFLSQVAIGTPARARVGAYPLEYFPLAIFQGQVAAISPTVNPRARTFTIRVELANPDGKLRPGMSVEVGLVLERYKKALLAPKEAVVKGELQTGLDLIYLIDDATAAAAGQPVQVSALAVSLGASDGVRYQLKEQLDAAGGQEKLAAALRVRELEGGLVVTTGAASLVDGQWVKVVR